MGINHNETEILFETRASYGDWRKYYELWI